LRLFVDQFFHEFSYFLPAIYIWTTQRQGDFHELTLLSYEETIDSINKTRLDILHLQRKIAGPTKDMDANEKKVQENEFRAELSFEKPNKTLPTLQIEDSNKTEIYRSPNINKASNETNKTVRKRRRKKGVTLGNQINGNASTNKNPSQVKISARDQKDLKVKNQSEQIIEKVIPEKEMQKITRGEFFKIQHKS